MVRVRTVPRHVSNGWLLGVAAALASDGGKVLRVFALFGLIHSVRRRAQIQYPRASMLPAISR